MQCAGPHIELPPLPFFMRVISPGVFGISMCFSCPDCNCDVTDQGYDGSWHPCSDYLGYNSKLMGGYAGLATALAFAVEYQGEATPHAYGFVSLANMYQYHTLEEVGRILEKNAQGMSPDVMLRRLFRFREHLQKEDHFYPQEHEDNLESLEKQFHANNAGPPENIYISVRPSFNGEPSSQEEASPSCFDRPALLVFQNTCSAPSLWHPVAR